MAQAGDQQQFCLRWNDFQTNMVSSFKHLRDEKSFTDVTLGKIVGTSVVEGVQILSNVFRLLHPTKQ